MAQGFRRQYRRTLRWLRKTFPLRFQVRIALVPDHVLPDRLGEWYTLSDEEGVIRLRKGLSEDVLIETLFEEWAHARTDGLEDTDGRDDPHHHPTFWAELGRISQAYRSANW